MFPNTFLPFNNNEKKTEERTGDVKTRFTETQPMLQIQVDNNFNNNNKSNNNNTTFVFFLASLCVNVPLFCDEDDAIFLNKCKSEFVGLFM